MRLPLPLNSQLGSYGSFGYKQNISSISVLLLPKSCLLAKFGYLKDTLSKFIICIHMEQEGLMTIWVPLFVFICSDDHKVGWFY